MGENPADAAFLSLAHKSLGHAKKADKAREDLKDLMSQPRWKYDKTGIEVRREIEQAFASR